MWRRAGLTRTTRRHVPEDDIFTVTAVKTSNPTHQFLVGWESKPLNHRIGAKWQILLPSFPFLGKTNAYISNGKPYYSQI
jgi:hypothetical protein